MSVTCRTASPTVTAARFAPSYPRAGAYDLPPTTAGTPPLPPYPPQPPAPPQPRPASAAPTPLRRGTWSKALLGGAGLWALTIAVTIATRNVHLVPTLILLGSFLVPFAITLLAMERTAGAISAARIVTVFFVGGIFGVLGASLLESQLHRSVFVFLAVGLIEEFVKAVILLVAARTITVRTPAIGAFLGAAVGAGFAAFESAGYAFNSAISADHISLFALLQTELLRGALAPVGDILWTALVGAALFTALGRRARTSGRQRIPWGRVGLTFLGVAVLHGAWDIAGGLAAYLAYVVTGAAAFAQRTGGFLPASAEPVIALTTMAIYFGFVVVLSAIGITWLVLAVRRGRRTARPQIVSAEAVPGFPETPRF